MFATFTQPALKSTLQDLSRAAARKSTSLMVLRNVHMSISGDLVTFRANDLETAVSIDVIADGPVDGSGATTFPVRDALAFVRATAKDSGVRILADDRGVLLSNGAGASTLLPAIDPEEFPTTTELGEPIGEFDGPPLLAALKRALVCVATDEIRPILAGVHVKPSASMIELAAADNYRIAVESVEAVWLAPDVEPFTVSGASIKAALAVLKGADAVILHKSPMLIDLVAGDVHVTCRLIDGTYPNYESVLPVKTDYSTTFDTAELRAAVKSITPAAKSGANVVRLAANGRLELQAEGASASVLSATSGLDPDDEYATATIAFNARYLAEALATLEERGRMSFNGPLQPAVLTSDMFDGMYRTLLMPVRVPS